MSLPKRNSADGRCYWMKPEVQEELQPLFDQCIQDAIDGRITRLDSLWPPVVVSSEGAPFEVWQLLRTWTEAQRAETLDAEKAIAFSEMTKDQLLSLWNADNWEVMSCGVYFTAHRADADKELHINCNDYTEAEILAMPFWERLAQELDELDRQAHEILQKEFPDDEDIPGLALTDITIDKSGCYGTFSLCYDTGDSPAGELYLNVSFDEQFVPGPKVGYDTF